MHILSVMTFHPNEFNFLQFKIQFVRPVSAAAAILHLEQIVDLSWGAINIH